MSHEWEKLQYGNLVERILRRGDYRQTRNVATKAVFGEMLEIDCKKSFPLLQGRKLFYKPVLGELAAMLRGPKNVNDFKQFGCNYWDAWGGPNGELTLDYGNSWIDFNGVNQLEQVIDKLKNNPTDRRILISGWRPDMLDTLSLPCCHMLYQWFVREGKYLDMIWYQRSVDVMVGLPSDIVLAAAWNGLIANECDLKPGKITMMLGDCHIYENHVFQADKYLNQLMSAAPAMDFKYQFIPQSSTKSFVPTDLIIYDYDDNHQPPIKFELNV